MAMRGQGKQGANLASRAATGGMGHDAVRLKSGGAQMTVSKFFKSPEGREMVQCTWFDKKPREHRAAFVMDSLEVVVAKAAGNSRSSVTFTVKTRRPIV